MTAIRSRQARRFLAPEVIQTSAMDCGPAALKCLLEGFGVRASYGRLREACQTSVDGTSIDALESVANLLGLEAQQIIESADHILMPEAQLLPALVVVWLPSGLTHFVVVWNVVGSYVQVMDPGRGRRWVRRAEFVRDLYVHAMPVSAAGWRSWAASDGFCKPLSGRLRALGARPERRQRLGARRAKAALPPQPIAGGAEPLGGSALIDRALADPSWRGLAALDAATRVTEALVASGAVRRGARAAALVADLAARPFEELAAALRPEDRPAQPGPPGPDGEEQILLTGAVLLRVRGRREAPAAPGAPAAPEADAQVAGTEPLPPELAAALSEPPARPGAEILRLLRADGLLRWGGLALALVLAGGSAVFETVLFRGLFDVWRYLDLFEQRLAAVAAVAVFFVGTLLVEYPLAAELRGAGRRLEARMRRRFLRKIPRMEDRYFQSRPVSDMAERAYRIHHLRQLPGYGGQLLRCVAQVLVTTAGICWLHPASAPLAVALAATVFAVPLAMHGRLSERELRMRSHAGALSRFYLDALLGLVAVRCHGAERSLEREHHERLLEWARAGRLLQRAAVTTEGLQALAGVACGGALLFNYLQSAPASGWTLLLVYWALNLPVLGQQIAYLVAQYPVHRNTTLRLLEPLGAPEAPAQEVPAHDDASPPPAARGAGIAVAFEGVRVEANGHQLLAMDAFEIPAGCHLAVVGPSGAGKTTLLGLLLGWHRAAAGRVMIDGGVLDPARLDELRAATVWIDPAVQIWNRSLLDNLTYGADRDLGGLPEVLEQADLETLLGRLPLGLQTGLGEGGGLLSGGEAQRVRFGRGLMRATPRLVLLDEPFRGLDRGRRAELLRRARARWQGATLICVTHDLAETAGFDQVAVIERGQIVERGAPGALRWRPQGRYRALLEAEQAVERELWGDPRWRRLTLSAGRLHPPLHRRSDDDRAA